MKIFLNGPQKTKKITRKPPKISPIYVIDNKISFLF